MSGPTVTRRQAIVAAAGARLANVAALSLSGHASAAGGLAADRALIAAESEITERRTYLEAQADVDSWKEPWKGIFERIWELEDFVSQTAPQSLAGCAVKLRRLLDADVGLVSGRRDSDVLSLAQVLNFVHGMTGEPMHPTRPTVQSWDDNET